MEFSSCGTCITFEMLVVPTNLHMEGDGNTAILKRIQPSSQVTNTKRLWNVQQTAVSLMRDESSKQLYIPWFFSVCELSLMIIFPCSLILSCFLRGPSFSGIGSNTPTEAFDDMFFCILSAKCSFFSRDSCCYIFWTYRDVMIITCELLLHNIVLHCLMDVRDLY